MSDDIFGELRGLLAHGNLEDEARKAALVDLLLPAYQEDPQRYREHIVAYLSGLRLEWPVPFGECEDLDELALMREVLPMTSFGLRLNSMHLLASQEQAPLHTHKPVRHVDAGTHLEGVSHLRVDTDFTSPEALQQLMRARTPERLAQISFERSPSRYTPMTIPTEYTRALVAAPLPALHTLDMTGCDLGDEGAQLLSCDARWPRLRTLKLARPGFRTGGMRALCGAAFIPHVEELSLARSYAPGAELLALFEHGPLALRHLDVGHVHIPDEVLERLAARDLTPHLQALLAPNASVSDAGARALFHSPHLPALRRLELSGNPLTGDSLATLHSAPALEGLRVLDLNECAIDDLTISSLARSPFLAHLEELYLRHQPERQIFAPAQPGPGTPGGARVSSMLKRMSPEHMRKLSLRACELDEDAVDALARLHKLEHLTLTGSLLSEQTYARLLDAPLPHLKTLSLRATNLNAALLGRFLGSCPHPRLEHLYLDCNPLGDASLPHVLSRARLPALKLLSMDHTQLTDFGARILEQAHAFIQELSLFSMLSNNFSAQTTDQLTQRHGTRISVREILRIG